MKASKFRRVGGLGNSSARSIDTGVPRRGNMRFQLAMVAIGLTAPLSVQAGLVINFHDANQGYSYYGGYNTLMYGQGAAPDLGNNVWNGFDNTNSGPGQTAFFGPGNLNSGHGSVPNNEPGNPYAWYGGTSSTGTNLFSPANPGAFPASGLANAYSNGTASPITLSLSDYTGDNGVNNVGHNGIIQGAPNKILSEAAIVNNGAVGTFTLGGVPTTTGVTYDLYLYGANYNGDRGAAFNVTTSSFVPVGGYTQTLNPDTGAAINTFILGGDYVEFTGITPTAAGIISGTWGAVSNPISGNTGEGDFNGLQLVAVAPTTTLIYTGTGTPPGQFDTLSDQNFSFNGSAASFANGDTVIFDDTATGPHTVTVGAAGVSPGAVIFNNNTSSYTLSGGPITGNGTLSLDGTGTVTLTSANTYTGATAVNSGTLDLPAGGSIASTLVGVSPGGTLNLATAGALTGAGLSVLDNGTINLSTSNNLGGLSGGGTVNLLASPSTLTLTGGSFSGTYSASGSILNLTGAGGTFGAAINDGSSANSVVVNSTGIWILAGNNGYSGGTNVSAGVASAGSASPFGTGNVVLAGGSLGASYTAGAAQVPGTVSGGALVLADAGAGVLELTGNNTFTGPVTIEGSSDGNLGGTLEIQAQSGLGLATTITVQSGGSFEVNGSFGAGDTLTISGPGMTTTGPSGSGPSGALRGADVETNDLWAGNVNVSGPAYVAAGADGELTLTGSIIGSGTLVITNNANTAGGSAVVLGPSGSNANTYIGETQILPGAVVGAFLGVQLGANNGFSPNSGLNFLAGADQTVTVDLSSYNQSLTYLIGAPAPGYSLTNSNSSSSTLSITSGLKAGVQSIFATAITGNVSVVMNDPTGAGNQILAGANTYTGTTTITKGTLTAGSSTALSAGLVTLNGGTLSLTAVGTVPISPIVSSAGFGSLVLNEGATGTFAPTVTGGSLQLTENGVGGIANSAFFPTKVPVSDSQGFIATFQYQASSTGTPADGITFVLQNDSRGTAAVGGGGGELGYSGGNNNAGGNAILNSAAVEFELYPPSGTGYGTAFGSEGLVPGNTGNPVTNYTSVLPINMSDNDLLDISLIYDGPAQALLENIVDTSSGATFSTLFTGIDYSALVGGPAGGSTTAYLGFTGATGGANATQTISNFNYSLGYSTPQSIANTIVAATGTTSVIQIGVSNGSPTNTASVGAIQISSGATVHVTTLGAGVRGVLATPSISIAPTGQLDLGSNDLDIAAGGNTLAQVTALVASGYNNGKWNGSGIASSAAAADTTHLTALGVIVNDNGSGTPLYGTSGTIASTFDGDTLAADGDILVKYTYYGDATLQGSVTATDYSRIDNGYLNHLTGWYNGDFNYDGVVNGSDYTLIDNAFNMQGGSNPLAEDASSTAQVAAAVPPVPEPATLGLMAVGAVGLLGKRRRRN